MSHKLVSLYIGDGEYYTRTDADNVIAELKKERDWLAKDRAQAYDDLEKRAQLNINQEESIRHQKYKRCLAMALLALEKRETYRAEYEEWCLKWYKRWLELAEKFKINSTAQRAKRK